MAWNQNGLQVKLLVFACTECAEVHGVRGSCELQRAVSYDMLLKVFSVSGKAFFFFFFRIWLPRAFRFPKYESIKIY